MKGPEDLPEDFGEAELMDLEGEDYISYNEWHAFLLGSCIGLTLGLISIISPVIGVLLLLDFVLDSFTVSLHYVLNRCFLGFHGTKYYATVRLEPWYYLPPLTITFLLLTILF